MSRRYIQSVRVRTDERDAPVQFLWRGRSYRISAVLGYWVEGSAWWRRIQRPAAPAESHVVSSDREVWRVEAGASGYRSLGVYDLCRDTVVVLGGPRHRWRLARVLD